MIDVEQLAFHGAAIGRLSGSVAANVPTSVAGADPTALSAAVSLAATVIFWL